MSLKRKIFKKLLIGFIIITLVNIIITNFILNLPIQVQLGFIDLSNFFKSLLLNVIGLIEFLLLYIFSVGFGGSK